MLKKKPTTEWYLIDTSNPDPVVLSPLDKVLAKMVCIRLTCSYKWSLFIRELQSLRQYYFRKY